MKNDTISKLNAKRGNFLCDLLKEFEIEEWSKQQKRIVVNKIIEKSHSQNYIIKCITINENMKLRDAPSFSLVPSIIDKTWVNYFLKKYIEKQWIFVVWLKYNNTIDILYRIIPFSFSREDIVVIKLFFEKIKKIFDETAQSWTINGKKYNNIPKQSETKIIHLRPKAKNNRDTYVLNSGTEIVKQGVFLNKKFVQKIIRKNQ